VIFWRSPALKPGRGERLDTAPQFSLLKHSLEQALMTILRWMMIGAIPTPAVLSVLVGTSPRTLRRRLPGSRTSFQRLLRQVLREAADEELAHRPLSQAEITFLLGYSEESASSRAYRSWTEEHRAQSVALGWRLCEAANKP
jgi:AraC-like DNA-binding protein